MTRRNPKDGAMDLCRGRRRLLLLFPRSWSRPADEGEFEGQHQDASALSVPFQFGRPSQLGPFWPKRTHRTASVMSLLGLYGRNGFPGVDFKIMAVESRLHGWIPDQDPPCSGLSPRWRKKEAFHFHDPPQGTHNHTTGAALHYTLLQIGSRVYLIPSAWHHLPSQSTA